MGSNAERRARLLLIGVLLVALGARAPAVENALGATVERLHETLTEVMRQARTLGFAGRKARLEPVLLDTYDFPYVSRLVLGRHWKNLSAAERERMVETFTELTITTYAARFDGYAGEHFETVAERLDDKGRVLVRTRLESPDGAAVSLDYLLHRGEAGDYRIVNVLADGVSEISLKRAEYSKVVRRQGFDKLIGMLEKQIADFASGGES